MFSSHPLPPVPHLLASSNSVDTPDQLSQHPRRRQPPLQIAPPPVDAPPSHSHRQAGSPLLSSSVPLMPAAKATTTSPTRLVRHAPTLDPPLPPNASGYGEEDLVLSSPASPSLGGPRPVSPHGTRFMRKISKWKGRDELDFGCAGEWSSEGPTDLGDRYYSSNAGGNRASTSSSVYVPSLTHSRAHSSSSDFSTSTVESSLPPSPTPSSCSSLGGHNTTSAPMSPLPYTSRVPLTPRTAQRKRQSDEVAAIDALNDYFTRVRLSQIQEDPSPRGSFSASTVRGSFDSQHGGGPLRISTASSQTYREPMELEIEIIDNGLGSSFTPLKLSSSTFTSFTPDFATAPSPTPSSEHSHQSSSSSSSTIHRHSPIPDDKISGELEELSEYFTSSESTSPISTRSMPLLPIPKTHQVPRSLRVGHRRPSQTSNGGMARASVFVPAPEQRVQYGWI